VISQQLAIDMDEYTFNTVEPVLHFWQRNRISYHQMFEKVRQLEPQQQAELTKFATQVVEEIFRSPSNGAP